MYDHLASHYGPWLEPALALAVGTAVIVALAALAGRWVTAALWRRTIWQVAALGLLALVLVELTGTGRALTELSRPRVERARTERAERTMTNVTSAQPQPNRVALSWSADDFSLVKESALPPTVEESFEEAWAAAVARDLASFDPASGDSANMRAAPRKNIEDSFAREYQAQEYGPAKATPPVLAGEPEPIHSGDRPTGLGWLGWIWVLLAGAILGWVVCARVMLWRFRRRHAAPDDATLGHRVAVLARRLGLRRPVCLLEAASLRVPVAFGTFRPTIVLPPRFAEEFELRQQEAVLAHELAHLAARDPAWQLLADLLCAVLWWQPLAWWLRRRLRASSEAAADEASLLVPGGPDALAGCLVAMGRRLAGPGRLGWVSIEGGGFRSSLGRRVERLLDLPKRSRRVPGRRRLALAKTALPLSLVLVAVLCTTWVRPRANLAKGETTMSVFTTSWRHSLAAVALTALMTTVGGDAVADDSPTGEAGVAVAPDDLAGEELGLALLAEDAEGERREGGDRERGEGEVRRDADRGEEGEARREREGDAREGDRRERDGEAREGERRERDGEAREGDRRERAEHEGDAREPRERREGDAREPREREEGDRRESPERERREGEGREARERLGDERARHIDALRGEFHELRELGQRIRREIGDRGPDHDDEAHQLHARLRDVEHRMAQIEREVHDAERERPRDDGPPPERREAEALLDRLHQEQNELQRRAAEIEREMRGLRDDQDDEARELQRLMADVHAAAERVEREIHEIKQGIMDRPDGPPPEDRERLQRRLEELRREIGRLSEAGRHEEAERLKREGREIMQALQGRPAPPPPGPPEDLQRRVQHLQAAIENLHAAGLHEAAEKLSQELERRMGEMRERGHRPPEPPRPPEFRDRPPQPPHPEEVIGQLRGEVEQLRREMNELRGMLRELLQREP